LELLLLLTAFLASLTGVGQADRLGVQGQGVAVVHAAQTMQVAVQPVRRSVPVAVVPALRPVRTIWPASATAPLPVLHFAFERRLE
jgi:hypothetical protein